ncbi:MAG: hypothetical protein QOE80_3716 [Actinomycetota bacterium]|nr:hypothetical protein [Actinomycetota bacterium]
MGFAVVVGVFGLVGVHPAESRADATTGDAAPVLELPVPPPLLTTDPPTTTTTAPLDTTTTTGPPETTTTTVPPPPAAPPPPTIGPPTPQPPPAAPVRRAASTGPAAQAEVEAIADSSRWNWRAAGVRFNLSFYPADCCHWGVYEAATSTIWVGPTAFEDQNRLRYVVLHELAHAWQYRQNRFAQFISDYTAWGFGTIGPALEAGADCVANVWGAGGGHYWNCPPDARALATRRLAGDWR